MLPPWREYAASAKAWCTRAKALGHKRVYTNNIGLGTSTRPAGPALHTRARWGALTTNQPDFFLNKIVTRTPRFYPARHSRARLG